MTPNKLLTFEVTISPEAATNVREKLRAQMMLKVIGLDPLQPTNTATFELDLAPEPLDESWRLYLAASTKASSQVRAQIARTLAVSQGWNAVPVIRDEFLEKVWPPSARRMLVRRELWSLLAKEHGDTALSYATAVRNTFTSAIATMGLDPDELTRCEERFAKDGWDQQERMKKWESQYRAGRPLKA